MFFGFVDYNMYLTVCFEPSYVVYDAFFLKGHYFYYQCSEIAT